MKSALSFMFSIDASVLAFIQFAGMMSCIVIGARVATKRHQKADYIANAANKTIFTSVFGLMAFLLAFTFGMSGSRFQERRLLDVEEAEAIHTAIYRADLYPENERIAFRNDFKEYLEARIGYINDWHTESRHRFDVLKHEIAKRLWARTIRLSADQSSIVPSLQMTTALNEMFGAADARDYGELFRVPQTIVVMLFILSFVSAFFVGYLSIEKGKMDWYVVSGFCFLSAMVLYITLDLDRPHRGLITTDASRQAIISIREEFEH